MNGSPSLGVTSTWAVMVMSSPVGTPFSMPTVSNRSKVKVRSPHCWGCFFFRVRKLFTRSSTLSTMWPPGAM